MTREEALESGICRVFEMVGGLEPGDAADACAAARGTIEWCYRDGGTPDELEGFAVGLQLVAVEVAEIARKRREAAAEPEVETEATKPDGEAFTYERVEVAGPAGDPIWTYERRPLRTS